MKNLACDPKLFEKELSGTVTIVTGANSGTGLATVQQLVKQGAHVVAACRRMNAGRQAVASLSGERGSVEVMELDLGSLASVRAFAEAFLGKHDRLDALVNNAGVMNTPKGKTADGFETQFGVNHLGHFLLTELLLEVLKKSAPSRIVCVASAAHAGFSGKPGELVLDDLDFARRGYDPALAYNQSKLANVIYARHLARRLEGTLVSVFSVHPGWVRSNLVKHTMPSWIQNWVMRPFGGLLGLMGPKEGAQTQLHCLLDDDAPKHSGEYFSQNAIFYADKQDKNGGWPMRSPNPLVYDDALADRLFEVSNKLVGLEVDRTARF
jgi:NAD(P)-dependent dehydrogenase (short-subunit alcohol dehydrogenase family)